MNVLCSPSSFSNQCAMDHLSAGYRWRLSAGMLQSSPSLSVPVKVQRVRRRGPLYSLSGWSGSLVNSLMMNEVPLGLVELADEECALL